MAKISDVYEVTSKANLGGLKKATKAVVEHGKAIGGVAKKAANLPFKAIQKGFAGIKKGAEVAAKGFALFGLASQGLTAARDMLGGLFEAMREASPEFGKALDRFNEGFNQVKKTVLSALAKALIPILNKLAEVMADPRFQAFIETLATFLADAITKVADFLFNQAVPALVDFWNSIQPVISTLIDTLVPVLETVYAKLAEFWADVQPRLQAAWTAISNFISDTIGKIASFIQTHWDNISKILEGAMKVITGILETAWNVIYGGVKVVLALISGDWSAAWEALKGVTEGVWNGIKNIVSGALDVIGGLLGMLGEALRKPWEGLTGFISGILDGAKAVLESGINSVINFLNGLIQGFNDTLGRVPGVPNIKKLQLVSLAAGGIIDSPVAAVVGDNPRAPEVVAPLDDLVGILQRALGGGGMNVNLNVTVAPGGFATPEEAGQRAGDAFVQTMQSRGLRI